MSSRKDIIAAVEKCLAEYRVDRMTACIRSLISSYLGCLDTGGVNTYKTHRGVGKNTRHGFEVFAVAKFVVDKDRETLARLKAAGDDPTPAKGGGRPDPYRSGTRWEFQRDILQ